MRPLLMQPVALPTTGAESSFLNIIAEDANLRDQNGAETSNFAARLLRFYRALIVDLPTAVGTLASYLKLISYPHASLPSTSVTRFNASSLVLTVM